jgi:outer membrane protein
MRSKLLFLLGALFMFGTSTLEAQTLRIGYIDSQAILALAPGAQEAQTEFEREMDRYRGELQRLGEELERLIQQYQQQQRNLTPEAREARELEIQRRQFAYEARLEEIDDEANRRRQALVEPILQRMSDAIEAIREEGDYALIFDTAARAIIAADPSLDLTETVLARLRQMAGEDN